MKELIKQGAYLAGMVLMVSAIIFMWMVAWNVIMPTFGMPQITFIQSACMFLMAMLVKAWILIH